MRSATGGDVGPPTRGPSSSAAPARTGGEIDRAERERGDFAGVHWAPDTSGDVPDEDRARLVVFGPQHPHVPRASDSPARKFAEEVLERRGSAPRMYRNMLLFLAPASAQLRELEQAIRDLLAWQSIVNDAERLELQRSQRQQAETKLEEAKVAVAERIRETYCWLLVPTQDRENPLMGTEWREMRLQGGDPIAVRPSRSAVRDEYLITHYAATNLRLQLDHWLWRDRDHIGLRELWEALPTYLYFPRFRDSSVLIGAVEDGVGQMVLDDVFAYADSWDEATGRYRGLRAGKQGVVTLGGGSVLVKPEVARRQLTEDGEKVAPGPGDAEGRGRGPEPIGPVSPPPETTPPPTQKFTRFYGRKALNPLRIAGDAGQVANEVVQHLSSLLPSEVEVVLEIRVSVPDGIPENVVRIMTENARALKFESQGFGCN